MRTTAIKAKQSVCERAEARVSVPGFEELIHIQCNSCSRRPQCGGTGSTAVDEVFETPKTINIS